MPRARRIGCRELLVLIEALVEAERVKPVQVAMREVFRRHGLLGQPVMRALAAIMYKVYRFQGILDKLVDMVAPGSEAAAREALRLAAYIFHFDRVAGEELSRLVESCLPGRVEGVTREALERLRRIEYRPSSWEELAEYRFLVPAYLVKLLSRFIPRGELEELLEALNKPLPMGMRVNTLKASVEEVAEELRRAGAEVLPSRAPSHVRYIGAINYFAFKPLLEGKAVPQDEASALAAPLLSPRPGERIVDLCAAPGGKTTHLAELSRNMALIVAIDVSGRRLGRLRVLAERTGTSISIHPVAADGRAAPSLLGEEWADKVLLDPPCSSTGVLSKHPDAKWRLTPERLRMLVERQRALLEAAHRLLKPGGLLLYTTCSILPVEGEGNIRWLLWRHPCYEVIPLDLPYEESPWLPGTVRAWPHKHGVSGFFYALLRKTGRC
ncbi:MAG: RsmB/NOP family class I SAM-dependent RNA methyltransferase [Crenarchaeota archaeon]|nr:RsmB/NOP family class I SAM-dependent RNA methyltransferase [Thermoproteota archaeon]